MYEPNDIRSSAADLGSIPENTSYPSGTVEAWVDDLDADWFSFRVTNTALGSTAPRVELNAFGMPTGAGFSVCLYYECDGGASNVTCNAGAPSTRNGLDGCCASGVQATAAGLGPGCPGPISDEGTAYVLVEAIGDAACDPYSLTWGDD